MTQFLDENETRSFDQRASDLAKRLPEQIRNAKTYAPGFANVLENIEPETICEKSDLEKIDVLRKSDLIRLQQANPPFGGFSNSKVKPDFVFQSPGPIYDPGSKAVDWWNLSRFLNAVGIGADDRVQNCFSYHLTPAGKMMESAALALGASVLPAGVGNTEQQAEAASFLKITAYCGTPEYLLTILKKANELNLDLTMLKKAAVSGGPLFPQVREEYSSRGITCLQAYATADLGSIAYETVPDCPLIVDENVLVEIVTPGSGLPVDDGEIGEVIVTSLNPDYPLIRFATGDLSAIAPGLSSCGRTNTRIVGWRGRADQSAKVKGMFVRPEQVAILRERHPSIKKTRIEINIKDNKDVMTVKIEAEGLQSSEVENTVKDILKLKAKVEIVSLGSLPNDGLVIDDLRPQLVT
ncbi:MAG: phenylacetate--CoA ligase family protein [Paracoccaceae bacterium]|nr:phenylacetate--CoA ligase family protein [Paracoccaceae bacterium]